MRLDWFKTSKRVINLVNLKLNAQEMAKKRSWQKETLTKQRWRLHERLGNTQDRNLNALIEH